MFGFLVLCVLSIIWSCSNSNPNKPSNVNSSEQVIENKDLKQLEWLIGNWVNLTENSSSYEIWKKSSETEYSAHSYVIENGDTVFSEFVLLKQIDGIINYIVTVSDQNSQQAINFKLVSTQNGVFVFENLEHDFPQRIVYSNPVKDSLVAFIEGIENGKQQKIDFSFVRK
jgi:hypothetical protein